jgi:hypothetical protein
MSGTPTRLVKDGAMTSFDAPPGYTIAHDDRSHRIDSTASDADPSHGVQPHKTNCAQASGDPHTIPSSHRKLAVAETDNYPGRVASLREQIELLERLVRAPAPGADLERLQLERSLFASGLDRAISNRGEHDPITVQGTLLEGLLRLLDELRIARLPTVDLEEVEGVAPPTPLLIGNSEVTHPLRTSGEIPPMPNKLPSPRPIRAGKIKAPRSLRIICWTLALGVLPLSILATIYDFHRTTYHVTHINHRVLNPQEIRVSWIVHNTGMHTGTPHCEVNASSAGDADRGFATATGIKSIRAGGQQAAFTTLTITNDGAEHVAKVSVSC